MIAFTNHALDHMLSSVLDAGITNKIVRLGSRSADERVSKFNLDTMEMVHDKSRLDRSLQTQFKNLKETQEKMVKLMNNVRKTTVSGSQAEIYIAIHYGDHYMSLHAPPPWVITFRNLELENSSGWETMRSVELDESWFSYWEEGRELGFLAAQPTKTTTRTLPNSNTNRFDPLDLDVDDQESSEDEPAAVDTPHVPSNAGLAASWMQTWPKSSDVPITIAKDLQIDSPVPGEGLQATVTSQDDLTDEIFFGLGGKPDIPLSDEPLHKLLKPEVNMWHLSKKERSRLSRHWKDEVRRSLAKEHLDEFSRLRDQYERDRVCYHEIKDQVSTTELECIR